MNYLAAIITSIWCSSAVHAKVTADYARESYLLRSACAELLSAGAPAAVTVLPRVTHEEHDELIPVDATLEEIANYLGHFVPSINLKTDPEGYFLAFSALWRRIPEVRPPSELMPGRWPAARIQINWHSFRNAVATVPKACRHTNLPSDPVLRFDPVKAERVRLIVESRPRTLQLIENLPWDGRVIMRFLGERYHMTQHRLSQRRPKSADLFLDHLWNEFFGIERPWNLTRDADGSNCYEGRAHVGAPERVVEEWRLFRMMLNLHLPRP